MGLYSTRRIALPLVLLLCTACFGPASARADAVSLGSAAAWIAGSTGGAASLGAGQATQGSSSPAGPPATGDEIPVYLPGGEEAAPTLPSQRGIAPIRSGAGLFRITPFIGISAIYDTGLAPLTVRPDGTFPSNNSVGGQATFGVTGTRAFRQTVLNLVYGGGFTHYPNQPNLSQSNHRGAVGVNHAFSRRMQLSSQNSFGLVNNAFFGNAIVPGTTTPDSVATSNEFFNSPIIFIQSTQILTYQKSARTSFAFGGGGAIQERRSDALVSTRGVNAIGNVSFRLSPRQTLGVAYTFSQFFFSNLYGGSNIHSANLEYVYQLTKTTSVSLSAGGARVESQSIVQVQVDPLIAALFGSTSGVQADYRLVYVPTYFGAIQYGRRGWNASLSGGTSINAGNGIILTNRNTTVNAAIGYGTRLWNVNASTNYSKMSNLKLSEGDFEAVSGNVGFTLRLSRGLNWRSGFSVRQFGGGNSVISENFADRNQYRVETGIFWSPSEFALPLF